MKHRVHLSPEELEEYRNMAHDIMKRHKLNQAQMAECVGSKRCAFNNRLRGIVPTSLESFYAMKHVYREMM